jgi:alkylhydroperoxidase family enzyme
MAPFVLAAEPKVQNQAAMVALGRPGAGEALLADLGFRDVERIDLPFVFEFADPEAYARAIASTGPAFEAIQTVGEEAFRDAAVELASQHVRDGLPLRAHVALVGYLATKPDGPRRGRRDRVDAVLDDAPASFLVEPPADAAAQRLFDNDLEGVGYITNSSRLWAQLPPVLGGLSDLLREVTAAVSLTDAQRAVLVTAAASALGDSYCSLAWGKRLAEASSPETAAAVIRAGDEGLDRREQALARWARLVARDPNVVSSRDVQDLRDVGFDDPQIFAITTFVALRVAFATINDSLGALPDSELRASVPDAVRDAVTFGRGARGEEA